MVVLAKKKQQLHAKTVKILAVRRGTPVAEGELLQVGPGLLLSLDICVTMGLLLLQLRLQKALPKKLSKVVAMVLVRVKSARLKSTIGSRSPGRATAASSGMRDKLQRYRMMANTKCRAHLMRRGVGLSAP
jgi:hypothetical protein